MPRVFILIVFVCLICPLKFGILSWEENSSEGATHVCMMHIPQIPLLCDSGVRFCTSGYLPSQTLLFPVHAAALWLQETNQGLLILFIYLFIFCHRAKAKKRSCRSERPTWFQVYWHSTRSQCTCIRDTCSTCGIPLANVTWIYLLALLLSALDTVIRE